MLHERLSRCRPTVCLPYLELNHRVRLRPGHQEACLVWPALRGMSMRVLLVLEHKFAAVVGPRGGSPPTCFSALACSLHSIQPCGPGKGVSSRKGPISLALALR